MNDRKENPFFKVLQHEMFAKWLVSSKDEGSRLERNEKTILAWMNEDIHNRMDLGEVLLEYCGKNTNKDGADERKEEASSEEEEIEVILKSVNLEKHLHKLIHAELNSIKKLRLVTDEELLKSARILSERERGMLIQAFSLDLSNYANLTSLPKNLYIPGSVTLNNCMNLKALPEHMHVEGHLNAMHCRALVTIPKSITVKLNVNLSGCSSLRRFTLPRVSGDLVLADCMNLVTLPNNLYVSGNLILANCNLLKAIPPRLKVDASCVLVGCTNLRTIPDSLVVSKSLRCNGCCKLEQFPKLREVPRNIHLGGATSLKSFPSMKLAGHLSLDNCTSLTKIERGLSVWGSLSMVNCTSLQVLTDVSAGAGLSVDGCTSLSRLSEVFLDGGLSARRTRLTAIPNELSAIGGDLNLEECEHLEYLPPGLTVDGSLTLDKCSSLRELPPGLCVTKTLSCKELPIEEIPEDMTFGTDLNLEYCSNLTHLPSSVLTISHMRSDDKPHDVYLSGTALADEVLFQLQELHNPYLRFHVSLEEVITGIAYEEEMFPNLQTAIMTWCIHAGLSEGTGEDLLAVVSKHLKEHEKRTVLHFLSKLRMAKEYCNSNSRQGLANRVVEVLELLALDGDDLSRAETLQRMADSVDTCGDKPIFALNQMSVAVQIAAARGNREELRKVGLGVMRLGIVHKHVRKKIESLDFVDDVCVYLRFEIDLRKSLQLPVSALEMIFPSYMKIDNEEIERAKDEALAVTDLQFERWLANWGEWKRQLRLEASARIRYHDLKVNEIRRKRLSWTNLYGDPLEDPVFLKNAGPWSFKELMKHWVNTGMDFNNVVVKNEDYLLQHLTRCI